MVDPRIVESISRVKKRHEAEILAKKNVVGLGIGFRQRGGETSDELGLVVFVSKKLPDEAVSPEDRIPAFLDGVPVDVQEVGPIKAF